MPLAAPRAAESTGTHKAREGSLRCSDWTALCLVTALGGTLGVCKKLLLCYWIQNPQLLRPTMADNDEQVAKNLLVYAADKGTQDVDRQKINAIILEMSGDSKYTNEKKEKGTIPKSGSPRRARSSRPSTPPSDRSPATISPRPRHGSRSGGTSSTPGDVLCCG